MLDQMCLESHGQHFEIYGKVNVDLYGNLFTARAAITWQFRKSVSFDVVEF